MLHVIFRISLTWTTTFYVIYKVRLKRTSFHQVIIFTRRGPVLDGYVYNVRRILYNRVDRLFWRKFATCAYTLIHTIIYKFCNSNQIYKNPTRDQIKKVVVFFKHPKPEFQIRKNQDRSCRLRPSPPEFCGPSVQRFDANRHIIQILQSIQLLTSSFKKGRSPEFLL